MFPPLKIRACARAPATLLAAVFVLAFSGGCSTVSYYTQAVSGHLEIMARARPVSDVLAREDLTEGLRERLRTALQIRDFASQVLGLPDNGSYRRYADLGRPYALWNVVAAPEFSLAPERSCFPVAGCVAYRGFYEEAQARRYAQSLREAGDEVFVYGVPAYSTLGWFNDPLLNTFIAYPGAELAGLVFHELAHQLIYVSGDSAFNESFAVSVETVGVERWLASRPDPRETEAHARARARRADFDALVRRYQQRLGALYASGIAPGPMRRQKAEAFAQLRDDYAQLRSAWGGWPGYDFWFSADLNNAHLASLATYNRWVPAFEHLLDRAGGDLTLFYSSVRALAALDPAEREARLSALASGGA
jgi:predicted aminopeptidase